MKINITECTIVILGQWNTRVFSPQWVGQNLFHTEQIESELFVSPTTTPIRYTHNNILLLPGSDRLIIGAKNLENETLELAETIAKTALELLIHTPVMALGVNFGFSENENLENVINIFQLDDNNRLSDANCEILGTEITRKINIEKTLMNLKLSHEGDQVNIHANYHFNIISAADAIEKLNGKFVQFKDAALELLNNVYDLSLSDDEE